MKLFFELFDLFMYVIFAINVAYLFFFALVACFPHRIKRVKARRNKSIAILIPAYKEDKVIFECVDACMKQNYPKDKYEIVVISDRMTDEVNARLAAMPLKLVKVEFENSTKAKALNLAMSKIEDYDIAVVFDADNTINPDFLERVNEAFDNDKVKLLQAHRTAKNLDTNMALLDAVSEEINNSIFRKGHSMVGLSSALIGSGMAFDYKLFKQTMLGVDAVGGFDRALELTFLYAGWHINYLSDVDVYDEKVKSSDAFAGQRRRWMSAQLHYLGRFIVYLPKAFFKGNFDFCDKLCQQMQLPRVMLLGLTFIIAIVLSFVSFAMALKWWVIALMLLLALCMAVPRWLYRPQLFRAFAELPRSFGLMMLNLFKLKGANKKFIHTSHGD